MPNKSSFCFKQKHSEVPAKYGTPHKFDRQATLKKVEMQKNKILPWIEFALTS